MQNKRVVYFILCDILRVIQQRQPYIPEAAKILYKTFFFIIIIEHYYL